MLIAVKAMVSVLNRAATVAVLAGSIALPVVAEKKVAVKIQRSAPLRAVATGRQVVVGAVTGTCGPEFAALLSRDLAANGFAVATDGPADAVRVAVDVSRCEGRPREAMLGPGLPAMHISRTEGRFQARIRVFDGANRREIASKEIRGEAQQQNESPTGVPEYPAPSEIRQMAISNALASARTLFAPWIDRRELPIMDNKECNLRQAYDAVKGGDYPGFLRLSRGNVEACIENPKAAGAAWYNLGVALVLAGKHQEAVAVFGEAAKAGGPKPPDELLELCKAEIAAAETLRALKPAQAQ